MTKRKALIIGRHGKAPQKPEGGSYDVLTESSFDELYLKGLKLGEYVLGHGYTPERSFLVHTPKERTKHTGQAILVGAYDMRPEEGNHPPKSAEDLENYNALSLIDTHKDSRLLYGYPFDDGRDDGNLELYKRFGAAPVVNFWLSNPEAEEHIGEKIVPGATALSDCYNSAAENIERILKGGKDFGVMIAHAARVEGLLIPLINSARASPIKEVDDIGGVCEMGEHGELFIDVNNGEFAEAHLNYKGEDYKVDITEFMNK